MAQLPRAAHAGGDVRAPAQLSLNLPTPTDPTAPDLRIRVWHDDVVSFEGTRAQLESEPGLIPAGIVWPEARDLTKWEHNGLAFTLMRCPPAGQQRLPFKVWSRLDSWRVNCRPAGQFTDWPARVVQRKLRELQAAFHRASPEGRAQAWALCDRAATAARDEAFGHFKAQLLAAARKPGRKATQARAQGGAQ